MWKKFKIYLVFIPTLIWNLLLGRLLKIRRWWDRIDETLILGALPLPGDVPALAEEGVTCVVNTCAEYAGPIDAYEKHDIDQLRIPTVDFTHPELDDVTKAVDFIQDHVAGGSSVYVHCKAGRARSATVAMCWLIRNKNMTPKQVQTLLQEKRSHVNKYIHARPVVKKFYERHLAEAKKAESEH